MESLDRLSVLLVVGDTPVPLAATARGIAQRVADARDVAVFDLAGAFGSQDEDGLIRAFRDGRSLNALARPMADGDENRFVVPRGPGCIDDAIVRHERWPRLMSGFRERGALMIVVALNSASGLDVLSAMADSSVYLLERDDAFRLVAWPPSDADLFDEHATAPRDTIPAAAELRSESLPADFERASEAPADDEDPEDLEEEPEDEPLIAQPMEPRMAAAGVEESREAALRKSPPPLVRITPASTFVRVRARRRIGWAAVGTLFVLSIGGWYWAHARVHAPVPPDPTQTLASLATLPDSALVLPPLVNPQDSARSAGWGVELVATNDRAHAISRLYDNTTLSAATISPVVLGTDGGTWYKVIAGAYTQRAGAEYLRATLRQGGTIDDEAGVVAQAPYAFRLEHDLGADAAKARVVRYVARGVPAYALLDESSRASVYVGAFASPDQAIILLAELRAAGFQPQLAYRVGRTF
jgi:hypothetical protein